MIQALLLLFTPTVFSIPVHFSDQKFQADISPNYVPLYTVESRLFKSETVVAEVHKPACKTIAICISTGIIICAGLLMGYIWFFSAQGRRIRAARRLRKLMVEEDDGFEILLYVSR
jgi:hypothetical protein